MFLNTSSSLLLTDVITSIYANVHSERPWREPIEKLRVMLGASNFMMRIGQKDLSRRDAIFAYGPKVDRSLVSAWEERLFREVYPVSPKVGEVVFFRWEDVGVDENIIKQMNESDSSWTITHCFESQNGIECLLIGSRGADQSCFTEADGDLLKLIGQHFKIAVNLRRQIIRQSVTSELQAEALNRMSVAGALISQNRTAVPLNSAAHRLFDGNNGLRIKEGRIHACDSLDDRQLQNTIREVLCSADGSLITRGVLVSRPNGMRDLGIVVSARRSMSLVSGRPEVSALLLVKDSHTVAMPDSTLLQQLFSFTPAEANLAVGLAMGKPLDEVELELGIKHNTARAHLRSMFQKADVHRQSELIYLLANCVVGLGAIEPMEPVEHLKLN